jgi:hypothetical protein
MAPPNQWLIRTANRRRRAASLPPSHSSRLAPFLAGLEPVEGCPSFPDSRLLTPEFLPPRPLQATVHELRDRVFARFCPAGNPLRTEPL